MKSSFAWFVVMMSLMSVVADVGVAVEPVTLENVGDPGPNRLDEPNAPEFSLQRAVHFIDTAALDWQKQKNCFTCHTNYAYLYARPSVSAEGPAHSTVRKFAEDLVQIRWPASGPRWDAEVVATAAALAFNDAATTGKLHAATRTALDRMWTLQRADGGWNWLKCEWPPMESDDDYGVTVAALAVGVAPDGYAKTDAALNGMEKLRAYLSKNPPPTLHHEAMLLWASSYQDGLLSMPQREEIVRKLCALQKPEGGWNLPSLGNWKRDDNSPQDTDTCDGYATGFVTYVLRRAGTSADDARLLKALGWLKANQRESGRWITRSLHRDSKHFISHAGTSFAIMALAECEK